MMMLMLSLPLVFGDERFERRCAQCFANTTLPLVDIFDAILPLDLCFIRNTLLLWLVIVVSSLTTHSEEENQSDLSRCQSDGLKQLRRGFPSTAVLGIHK